ncbi:RibD family protein [Granulosicoccus antarcticus]|uniref:Riboflavin biosynthesis protein RibD n=1 Tax=Granulosicoccus antarcticus IMCC3135 TaxID=1192854 RepID=A0A2Z2NN94_9GAMM|nr:RibD family protein [Granulosicoccus antarcticus]ASJ71198.1 Riboflavin biosynthesis protein RibD [Granulosicoccus antarcticus IMCC3135]
MSSENPQTQAWALLQAARILADQHAFARNDCLSESTTNGDNGSCSFVFNLQSGAVDTLAGQIHDADLIHSPLEGWQYSNALPQAARDMLDLYLPVLGTATQTRVVIGHLGQSIDARIATLDGDAFFVTGEENRRHLHRLRSLCHAVVVGAATVSADDPQLTTRAVSGASPVRVIIDPQARVSQDSRVLHDGEAPTWLLHADTVALDSLPQSDGYRRLAVRSMDGRLQPQDILDVLAQNGLRRIFVEGGGVTVSRFFNARCLTRLQIATAPLLVGEGIASLQIPGAASMKLALRPDFRLYRMGQDVMWDFELSDEHWDSVSPQEPSNSTELQRLL